MTDPTLSICPKCGSTYHPDPDASALGLLRLNAGKVSAFRIASAAQISVERLRRIAEKHKIDLTVREPAGEGGA